MCVYPATCQNPECPDCNSEAVLEIEAIIDAYGWNADNLAREEAEPDEFFAERDEAYRRVVALIEELNYLQS